MTQTGANDEKTPRMGTGVHFHSSQRGRGRRLREPQAERRQSERTDLGPPSRRARAEMSITQVAFLVAPWHPESSLRAATHGPPFQGPGGTRLYTRAGGNGQGDYGDVTIPPAGRRHLRRERRRRRQWRFSSRTALDAMPWPIHRPSAPRRRLNGP